MTTATDPVATSSGVVRCRSSLLCSITAAIAVDSDRRRFVLLSALWRVSARELFGLGERAVRDAIVLPMPVPTADCVPAHTTTSSHEDEVRRGACSQ